MTETRKENDMPFTADINQQSAASDRVSLILDPEQLQVYAFGAIGSGVPERVWHRRHRRIASIPVHAEPESLAEWLCARESDFRELAACYLGEEWNGSNRVGRWSEDAEDLDYAITQALDEAFANGEITTYVADAAEWLGQCGAGPYLDLIREHGAEQAAQLTIDECRGQGALLRREDVEAWFGELAAEAEPRTYALFEEGYEYDTIEADSIADALAIAKSNADRSNYPIESEDGSESTMWIDVRVRCIETGEEASCTVTLDPDEPECAESEHDWQRPHSIVGGLRENPGVRGKGAGVIIKEVCTHCGCGKTADTWAQRSDTGEQGLESVTYTPGEYAAEVAAVRRGDR